MDDPTPRPLRRETKCTCEAPVPSGGLVLFGTIRSGHAVVAQPFLAVCFFLINFLDSDLILVVVDYPPTTSVATHYIV
jgi:hypothetical protein